MSNISKFPIDLDVNVDIKVKNKKGKLINNIKLHNKATRNMTEGIVRFLRGEFTDSNISLGSVGSYQNYAKYFIPAYMGIGDIGVNYLNSPPYVLTDEEKVKYKSQYTDESLLHEIFKGKIKETSSLTNNRLKIERSVLGDSASTDVYQLVLSSKINFNREFFGFHNSDGTNVNGDDYKGPYIISELGLFSADYGDNRSQLLARLLLSTETPLIIEEGTSVIINWTLGVRSLNDDLVDRTSYDYKFIGQDTEFTNVTWE